MNTLMIDDRAHFERIAYNDFDFKHEFLYEGKIRENYAPKEYPCIMVYHQYDNPNGRDFLSWEFIYKSEFEYAEEP